MIRRRSLLGASLAIGGVDVAGAAADAAAPTGPKVLRYAFVAAETGFDPARISDLYSSVVTAHIFEAPYRYDYLARPAKVVLNTASALPEASDDFRTFTIRIRPGIYFTPDAAFKGVPRELVAADYVYAWKRFFDPANKSPVQTEFADIGALGVAELRAEALRTKRPFDYDRAIEGVRAIDRYTLQFKLVAARPRLIYALANNGRFGAVAREVVEHYGEHVAEHPVGTGPFVLGEWRRSSRIVLQRNPGYREVRWDGEPAEDDAVGQVMLRRHRGKKLPLIDRVEIAIIEESQPRWLSFLNGDFDLVNIPLEFCAQALPAGKLAPYLHKRGIEIDRFVASDRTFYYFNMEDPVVGGMTAEKVALRRAISLASNTQEEIRRVRRGQAIAAQSDVAPGSYGYDPALRSDNSAYDPARAKALLDLYGYVDRDGDGWRERPDGSPLVLEYASQPSAIDREFEELWKKDMDAVAIRVRVRTAQWPEQLKAARAGQLMIWQLAFSNNTPDFQDALINVYGPASGGQNFARFKDAQCDALFVRMGALPDGPERLALLRELQRLLVAYAPYRQKVHRILNYVSQPRVQAFRFPSFGNQFWQHVDIDDSRGTGRAAA